MGGKHPHQKQVEIILTIASQGMQNDAQRTQEQEQSEHSATGHMHFLVKALASEFLTTPQQQQVEAVIELHKRCLYPLAYPSEEEDGK